MDFVRDRPRGARAFRALTIVDTNTRECVAIEVDVSLGSARVVAVLEWLAATRGRPRTIIVGNGPEFQSRALDAWAHAHGVLRHFIQPEKPTDNAYIESFNGKFRDECLNEQYFLTLDDARMLIERRRQHYTRVRPHSALHHQPPAGYAKQFFNQPDPELRVLKQA